MLKRFGRATVLAGALVALTAGATMAHECFIADRSVQGTEAAGTHSRSWMAVDLPTLATFISDPSDPEAPPALTDEQLAYFVARAQELGVPYEVALFVGGRPHQGGFTLAEGAAGYEKNGHSSDHKGLDHYLDAYGDEVFQAYMEALAQ